MTRVLFVTPPWTGHCLPLLGVACWLRRAGHHVSWLFSEPGGRDLAPLGIERLSPRRPTPPPIPYQPDDPAYWRQALRRKALLVPLIREVLQRARPDVVALEAAYEGMIAASLEGLPFARIYQSLTPLAPAGFDAPYFRIQRALEPERRELFEGFGLPLPSWGFHAPSPWWNSLFATAELVGPQALPARTFLVGPSHVPEARGPAPEFPWPRLRPDGRIVLVSFGTVHEPPLATVAALARAAAAHDTQVVLAAAAVVTHPTLRELPGDTIVVKEVPQLDLLARAAVFVTHGGANSVMEAMYHGVPPLVVPLALDQPLQGHFVTRAGVGLCLPPGAPASDYREALASLLEEGPLRRAARRASASYRAQDGARICAEALAGFMP